MAAALCRVSRWRPGELSKYELADSPFFSRAADFRRAYPNATFVCTTRSAESWANSMIFGHRAGGLYLPRIYGLNTPYSNTCIAPQPDARLSSASAPRVRRGQCHLDLRMAQPRMEPLLCGLTAGSGSAPRDKCEAKLRANAPWPRTHIEVSVGKMKVTTAAAARSDKNKHATAGAAAAVATTLSSLPVDTATATPRDDGTLQMRSVTTYLDQFGIRDLLPLHVVYFNHSEPVELHGDLTSLNNEGPTKGMLPRYLPSNGLYHHKRRRHTIRSHSLTLDRIQARQRWRAPSSAATLSLDGMQKQQQQQYSWRARHRWLRDDDQSASTPPGNTAKIPNRYFFLLLEHGVGYSELQLQGGPANRILSAKMRKTMPIFGISSRGC